MARTDLATTIERLKERLRAAQEKKRLADQRAKKLTTERLRRLNTRRKILMGALLLGAVERGDQEAARVMKRLVSTLTRPEDQALFEGIDTPPPAAPGEGNTPHPRP